MYEYVAGACVGALVTLIVTVWIYSGKCREYKEALAIKRAAWCADCFTKRDLVGAKEVIAEQQRKISKLTGLTNRSVYGPVRKMA